MKTEGNGVCGVLRTTPVPQERVLVLAVIVVSGRLGRGEEGADTGRDDDDDICVPHNPVRPHADPPRTVSPRSPISSSVKWGQSESLPHRVVGGEI